MALKSSFLSSIVDGAWFMSKANHIFKFYSVEFFFWIALTIKLNYTSFVGDKDQTWYSLSKYRTYS